MLGCLSLVASHFAPTVRSARKGPFRSRARRSPIGRLASAASAPGFRVTATAPDGVIEAIEHERLPIFCFQFHPEFYWKKDARFLDLLRRALNAAHKELHTP